MATLLVLPPALSLAEGEATSWKKVEAVLGRTGTYSGGTVKFGFPRTDLKVTLGGVTLKPGLALGSWVAFTGTEDSATMMGDLVLLQGEIEGVVDRLEAGGVMISALHNHLLGETPHVMYMHYMAHGNAETLAKTLKAALATTATPLALGPHSDAVKKSTAQAIKFDGKKIEEILGRKGSESAGVLSFGFPRAETIRAHGEEIPPLMGTANFINIQDAPEGVATTGDFVLIASEVNPVIQALRSAGISVTALHNHMLDEDPRLFFLHFWGEGPAVRIAAGIRSALDHVNLKH
ncbi:MAG: DUF1259 domain-containing protein [Acidobacteriia bacterium]|nr:DUF1259 domain-containing protein [Terriglobia bacterium]